MPIYDNWKEFKKMAREYRGTAGTNLSPPAPRWANISTYLDAIKVFFEIILLVFLCLINFYLWLDVYVYLKL